MPDSLENQLEVLFYSGNYREVIDRTVDLARPEFDESNLHWVIGALSFVGRLDEVDLLMASPQWDALTTERQAEAKFYQAIGMCRHSCYIQAAKRFFFHFRTDRKGSARQRFFVYQGLGFYAYFKGRYRQALVFARRASEEALSARFTYGRALAEDLKAHSLVQSGQIRLGIKTLRQAQRLAELLGSGGFAAATAVSIKLYESQFGILADPEKELTAMLESKSTHNNYSEANVFLELTQQLLLRGRRSAAEARLNEACGLIYESPNKRQGALLNQRYASVAFLKGEYYQALNLIRCGREELNKDIDTPILLQLAGLECDVKRELKLACDQSADARSLQSMRQRSQRYISWRLAMRHGELPESLREARSVRRGEDPLGDLIDLTMTNPREAMPSLVASGYWGLIPRALGIARDESCLYLDPLPGILVLAEKGEVQVASEGFTPAIRGFLTLLSRGPLTKEEIIVQLWGYRYHPEKHDSLVYRLVSRTRQLFDQFGGWLQSYENHYSLDPRVILRKGDVAKAVGSRPLEPTVPDAVIGIIEPVAGAKSTASATSEFTNSPLNARQLQLLKLINSEEYIDTQFYKDRFSVSDATARRDLSELVALNYLTRHGKARATKYVSAYH